MWNSVLWLQTFSSWALWIAALTGGVAVVSSFVSTVAANRASGIVQRQADVAIATANARAEEARLETLQIKEGLAWRELRPEQRSALVEALSGVTFEVYNTFVGDDPEAASFRHQIEAALTEAGVKTKYFSGWQQAAGVSVLGEDTPDRATLSDALKGAGIPHVVKPPHQTFGKGHPALLIGTKPERL